jgi:hypothetical protein
MEKIFIYEVKIIAKNNRFTKESEDIELAINEFRKRMLELEQRMNMYKEYIRFHIFEKEGKT